MTTRPRALAAAVSAALMPWASVHAMPAGWQTTVGTVDHQQTSSTSMQINVTSPNAATSYSGGFSIARPESVSISQVSKDSVFLIRDISGNRTDIFGSLSANGHIFLSNTSGILFGHSAQVSVGSLFATSLSMSDDQFKAGLKNGHFTWSKDGTAGEVANEAGIDGVKEHRIVTANGYTALVGPKVRNDGVIVARTGTVALAAGDRVSLDLIGDGLISLNVDQAALDASVIHRGRIEADGGHVLLMARSANALLDTVINSSGIIRANSLVERNGEIVLDGGSAGVVAVTGSLQAAGVDAGTTGGTVKVLGKYVGLFDKASIDASGDAGGGTVLIGGNFQGKGPEHNALRTYIGQDAVIHADAVTTGDGGKVIVWADDVTRFYGTASATGGSQSGNGGFIEISGHNSLAYRGAVDASAPRGHAGRVLFDPKNITIADGGADVVLLNDAFIENAAGSVTFDADSITTITNTGTDVALQANNDISVDEAITTNNLIGDGGDLTLQAGRSIIINANITTDNGAFTTVANETAANGVIDANRDPGAAAITMAAGTLVDTGTANISLTLSTGAGLTNSTSGDITLAGLTGSHVLVVNDGPTAGSSIRRADATQLITATSAALDTNGAGGGGSIGTAAEPIRLAVANLAARAQSGGAYFESPTLGINIGSATLGGLTGISTTGNFVIRAAGSITDSELVVVTGTTSLISTVGDITLDIGANDFTGAVSASATNITLVDATAIDLDTVSATGNLSVTAGTNISGSGAVTVGGTTSLTASAGDIALNNAANDFTGAVSASGVNISLVDADGIDLGTVTATGNLSVTAIGGNMIDSGTLTVAGTTSLTAAAGDITLDSAANDFAGVVNAVGTNITLVDATAIDLGTVNAAGDLSVTAGTDITDSGTVTVTGVTSLTATADDITLDSAANDFGGAVSASGANLTLVDATAIDLGTVSATGNLSVTAGTNISGSGAVTVDGTTSLTATAGDIALNNPGNEFGGAVSASGVNISLVDADGIDLGTVTATGNLSVTAISGNMIDSGTLTVAGTTSLTAAAGDITLDSAANDFAGVVNAVGTNITLVDATAIDLGTVNAAGDLSVTAGTDITDSGTVTVTGVTSLTATAGDITLDSAANDFGGAVSASGANVTLVDATAIDLGTVNATGNLSVSSSGAVTDSGTLTVAGSSTFTPGAGNSVTLDSAGNDFGGAVSVTNGLNATLVDASDLDLGPITITGDLSATATTGDITNTGGALSIGGNSVFTTDAAGASISVDNAGNAFTGTVSFAGAGGLANVTVVDTTALDLQALTLSGNLSATATSLTNSGALVIAGTTSATATAGDVALNNAGNDFTGAVSASGANITLVDATAIDLGTVSATGNLSVTAGTNISGSGAVTVGGATSLTATSGDIALNNAANDFTGALSASGANISLVDADAIDLGTVTATGSLSVTAITGDITDSGTLTVAGTTSLTAAAGDITLDSAANDFTGAVNAVGTNITLVDATAIDLGTVNAAGDLTVTAGTDITDSGTVTVTGATSLTASAGDITLDGAANDFSSIAATGGNITVVDVNALTATAAASGTLTLDAAGVLSTGGALSGTDVALLGDSGISLGHNVTATGTLGLTSINAAITQSAGTISATGATTVLAGTGNITLSQSTNDFSSISLSGGAIDVEDANNLTVGSLTNGVNQAVSLIAGGTLTLPASSINTGTADLTLASNGGTLTTAGALSGSNVSLTGSAGISLGHNVTASATLGLTSTNSAIDQTAGTITATGATTASAGTGAISLDSATNDFSSIAATGGNITMVDANNLTATAAASGTLTLDAGGVLSTGGALSGTDVALMGDGGISLGHNVTASGTLGLTSTNTAITQSAGTISATGATTVSAGAGNVTLAQSTNDFSSISLSGGAIDVEDANNLTVGSLTNGVNQAVSLIAGGTLTLPASSISTGTANLTLASNGGTLTTAGALSGNNVSFTGSGGISLGHNVTATGTLGLASTNSAIDQTAGTITATGATTASAGTGVISLDSVTNDFSSISATGGNVTVVDANNLTAAASASGTLTLDAGGVLTTGGTLSGTDVSLVGDGGISLGHNVTASGTLGLTSTNTAITQSAGTISATGATTASAGTGNITLSQSINDFGSISATGGNINVVDTNNLTATAAASGALTLDAGGVLTSGGALSGTNVALIGDGGISLGHNVTATGTLGLTSTNTAINQTGGTIAATGATTVSAGTGSITLSQSTNNFSSIGLSGGTVDVEDANNLIVTSLTSGANQAVSLVAGGTLTLPASSINTGTANLTLASNGGALATAGNLAGANVILIGAGGLTIGHNVTAGGPLVLRTTNAAINQTAGAIVAGGATNASAGVGAITLNRPGNDFQGVVTLSNSGANAVQIADANSVAIGASSLGGNFAVNAGSISVASISNSGSQQYNGSATLGGTYNTSGGAFGVSGDTVLASDTTINTSAGNVTFGGTINSQTVGGSSLQVNDGGVNTFGGAIGNTSALANIGTDSPGSSNLAGSVTVTGSINFLDVTTANGITMASTGNGAITVNNANATSPGIIITSGAVTLAGAIIGSSVAPLQFTVTPASLTMTQLVTAFFSGPTTSLPGSIVFPNGSSITYNGALIAQSFQQQQASNAASQASSSIAAVIVDEANKTFGTDSVAEDVEYGFAGEIGATPPMDHRIDETGISVPRCMEESREAAPCK